MIFFGVGIGELLIVGLLFLVLLSYIFRSRNARK